MCFEILPGLHGFFYWTGVLFYAISIFIVMAILCMYVTERYSKGIEASIQNLWFGLFGSRKLKGSYYDFWKNATKNKSFRDKWKSNKHFKRFAYTRLVKEARRELRDKINERVENI